MLNPVTAMATSLRQHLPFSSSHASLDDSDVASYYRNHVAAITGAGSGMGRELAIHLAKMGCHVALSDILNSWQRPNSYLPVMISTSL